MNRLQILSHIKAILATGSGQPDKHLAICFAVNALITKRRLCGQSREAARYIQDEVAAYLAPHLSFRQKLKASTKQTQAARHAYIDDLIQKESK
jgi:hypothetical protein